MVEKLIRSSPDIDKVYILKKAKRDKNVQERVNELWNVPAFDSSDTTTNLKERSLQLKAILQRRIVACQVQILNYCAIMLVL